MSRQLTFSIVADGGTDRALVPIVQWAVHRLDPDVEVLEPEFRKRSGSVVDYLSSYRTGAMIVFVHRDAEGVDHATRLAEFAEVERRDVVPVIPVRMTEAWLLIDGPSIARAAGRPSAEVVVPPVAQLESMANPKGRLEQLLLEAGGPHTGRRAKLFKAALPSMRVDVASLITDYSPLEALPSFKEFQAALAQVYPYART